MKLSVVTLGLCTLFSTAFAQNCESYQFECADGTCIPEQYACDWHDDCEDGSDEPDDPDLCPPCFGTQFRCDNGRCIRGLYKCDGDNDCRDWSDEAEKECPCPGGYFRCNVPEPPPGQHYPPGGCIPPYWICDDDRIWDCPDGSDEANCTTHVIQ